MARQISSYPITFPWGATIPPYSTAHHHKGNDLPLNYEPIVVGDTQIGISGATGQVEGPHCHVQAGYDLYAQNDIDSRPFIGKGGRVVRTGTASQWGNFVCVQVGNVYVYYCHLSRIDVGVGRIINDLQEDVLDTEDGKEIYRAVFHREPESDGAAAQWNGKKFSDASAGGIRSTPEFQAISQKVNDYDNVTQQVRDRDATISVLNQQLAAAQQTANDERSRADTLATTNESLTNQLSVHQSPTITTPVQEEAHVTEAVAKTEPAAKQSKTTLLVKLLAWVISPKKKTK